MITFLFLEMRILVTGCSGFIGSHLCERLIQMNYDVIGIDINPLPLDFIGRMTFVKEDIQGPITSIKTYRPELVIHLAALAGVQKSTEIPQQYASTNIIGTINILEACKSNHVQKIIYASSSTVYANEVNKDKLNTSFSLFSPYAITKKTCEMLFEYYGIKSIGLRFFSVYGPRGRKDMAPYIFINKIINDDIINVFGTGSIKRDFTYISDIIDGIMLSIHYMNENDFQHEIFNLGNSQSFTIRHFIHVIEKHLHKKAQIKYCEKRGCDSEITHADLSKSKRLLHYDPKVNLERGICETITYLTQQTLDESM